MKAFLVAAVLAAGLVAATASADTLPVYTVTAIAGSNSDGLGINSSGNVTGYYTSGGVTQAFLWTPGNGLTDAGTPGVASVGNDLSDSNEVVGQSGGFAFQWTSSGGLVQLDATDPGYAASINSSNTVFGTVTPVNTHNFVAEWSSSNTETFDFTGVTAQGYAINNAGQKVVRVKVGSNTFGSYSDGTSNTNFTRTLANFLPDDLNNANEISGTKNHVASVYSLSTSAVTTLGTLNLSDTSSEAYAINDLNQAVGASVTSLGNSAAFVWDSTNGLQSLTSELGSGYAGWTILSANAINNSGQIVGEGQFNGQDYAVVLTPTPEPGTLALVALGLSTAAAWLGWKRRTRPQRKAPSAAPDLLQFPAAAAPLETVRRAA